MGSAWIIGLALKPFAGLLIFGCIALPIRWAIHQWMPEGRIKTAILRHRLGKHRDAFMR
jgi:hypothetical protein